MLFNFNVEKANRVSGDLYDGEKSYHENVRELAKKLGGKGAGLYCLAANGFDVPPGFVIEVDQCKTYLANDGYFTKAVQKRIQTQLNKLSYKFGYFPLVSVRSGAPVSMPGMMDTVLNVGITQENLSEWKERLGTHTALDCYYRFLMMYADTVLGIEADRVEHWFGKYEDFRILEVEPKHGKIDNAIKTLKMKDFEVPDTVEGQIYGCVRAVWESFRSKNAKEYMAIHGIDPQVVRGTRVVVQSMVFGNRDDHSCTGVCFSRDPNTGENEVVGEFLVNAQGEDVVSGKVTPKSLYEMAEWDSDILDQLADFCEKAEIMYRDMVDIEFTVEQGTLYVLQVRSGKRLTSAKFKIAVDMVSEGLIGDGEAVSLFHKSDFKKAVQYKVRPEFADLPHYIGVASGGGLIEGEICSNSAKAVEAASQGRKVVLVTNETNPDDVAGMNAAVGVLTTTGGFTCHASVVVRGMNKACVVGCKDFPLGEFEDGKAITINGDTGEVWVLGGIIEKDSSDEQDHAYSWVINRLFKGMNVTGFSSDDSEDLFIQIGDSRVPYIISGSHDFKVKPKRVFLMGDIVPFEHEDQVFSKLVGDVSSGIPAEKITSILNSAGWAISGGQMDRDYEVIIGSPVVGYSDDDYKKLRDGGNFRVDAVRPINTLADLFSVRYTSEKGGLIAKHIVDDPGFSEFIKGLENLDNGVKLIPQPMSFDQALDKLYG